MAEHPTLLDAEAAHREHPRTFSIPRRAVREALVPGDLVKLTFAVSPPASGIDGERMWVEVTEAEGGTYVGRLDQRTSPSAGLAAWRRRPVRSFACLRARCRAVRSSLYIDPMAFAVVSRRVWDDDAWPGRLERRRLPDPQFSGWFVLAGDERSAYRDDPANFVPVAQATLFERFLGLGFRTGRTSRDHDALGRR